MNLLLYVTLLLIISYPQVGHIKFTNYFGISENNGQRIQQINIDHSDQISQKALTTTKSKIMNKICSHNPLRRFKDRFISKFQHSDDLVGNTEMNDYGNMTVPATKCKYYCIYETWYSLICLPTSPSF